jgi:hypothetical protein
MIVLAGLTLFQPGFSPVWLVPAGGAPGGRPQFHGAPGGTGKVPCHTADGCLITSHHLFFSHGRRPTTLPTLAASLILMGEPEYTTVDNHEILEDHELGSEGIPRRRWGANMGIIR